MSLPRLRARHTKWKEPLVDYSQSHVVINFGYLNILRRKTMEKVVVEEIKEGKWKEKEEKRVKWVIKLGFEANQIA